MKIKRYNFTFVPRIPVELEDGVLYICLPCNVVIHKCACGCGEKVVTPIDPKGWVLTYDGDTVSLTPSIGNWSYKCKSHYFIHRNIVEWARQWSDEEVNWGREKTTNKKKKFWKKYFRVNS